MSVATGTRATGTTRVVHAVCSHDCPDSCGVLVTVDGASGRAVKVAGDPAHPVTRGFLCGKVAKYLDRVYSPDRLLYPMRRRAGVAKGPDGYGRRKGLEAEAFERISWDEALNHVAERLHAIAAEFGPESVLPYSYAGTIGQLGFGSIDRRFFHRLGASQLDRTICSSAGAEALLRVYGVKLGTAPEDFARAGMVIAWGANIHGNNVHLWPFIEVARRGGAPLVVIDPYRTRTAALAEQHLPIRPGTDALLALGMMHVIFRDGLEDREYMDACTHGAADLRAHALGANHQPAAVERVTGIPAGTVERLAQDYATCFRRTGKGAAIRLNYGVQRSENGGTAARAVLMLPLVTGAWRHPGGGVQLSTSGAFPFNERALRMPELMWASPLGRAARVVNMSQLGWALTEMGQTDMGQTDMGRTDADEGPPVKALFVYNSNPAAVAPNANKVLAGMRRSDLFTVVHEQFFTDTADYADVLLPAPTFLEVKDVQGAYGHLYAQVSQRAIDPLGEARSNVRLFGELAQRMGFTEACFRDDDDDLIEAALKADAEDPSGCGAWMAGMTRERLEAEGQIHLDLPTDDSGQSMPFSTATWFRTPSGRGDLLPVPKFVPATESRAGAGAATGEFPLEFLPRKADNYMNTTFANLPGHQKMEAATAGVLEMSLRDAEPRSIRTGDAVEVFNRRGSVQLVARVTAGEAARVPQGVVAARLDWAKLFGERSNVNALTSERLTDIGGGATFYSTMVEVRPASADATSAQAVRDQRDPRDRGANA